MGDLIYFPKLKIGETITIEVSNEYYKCEVLSNEGDNLYKLRILSGNLKGKFMYFHMMSIEREQ